MATTDTLVAKWEQMSQGLTVVQQETILTNLLGRPSTLETLRDMSEEKKRRPVEHFGRDGERDQKIFVKEIDWCGGRIPLW